MSDIDDRNNSKPEAIPFFARYLEGQMDFMEEISQEEMQALEGGSKVTTRKYPSDNEDCPGGGAMKQKYPSDNEDGSGGEVVTLKFPSDNEEHAS